MVRNRPACRMPLNRVLLAGVLMSLLLAWPVLADKQLVVDLANVFTADEAVRLQEEAGQLGRAYAMDIVIVTTDDAGGKSARAFADNYFDEHGYGTDEAYSGILFLIDYDNREVYISTSGKAIRYLTDQRIASILDDVMPGMAAGDPFRAAGSFLSSTAAFLSAGIPSGQYTEEEKQPNRLTLGEGLISAVLAIAAALVFMTRTSGQYRGKNQQPIFEFRRNSIASLGIVQDQLVKTYVTQRIRPAPPPNRPGGGSTAGRSTVHRSSGGRMHGGGGRKF